ncbi:hypothetical protein KC360_g373 [Hortaea werneckii]|nr:hypothetical protein KC325_g1698 [Hortaea werneckii]KAI6998835.1 hypothetical protein KC359_g2078 [Hortaea werneckii]KAI7149330.1 hypothetical protein KC344_g1052 [Hortaea werneckii]KAI7180094.1 hypothetical protein KC360_g373 [Hortaea werneckii]
MATPSHQMASHHGQIQQKLQAHKDQMARAKAPAKANRENAAGMSEGTEGEDDSDDSSAMSDDDEDETDQTDGMALSGTQDSREHLAGLKADDMFSGDASQAVAGASMSSTNASSDDDYAGVEDISDDEGSVKASDMLRAAEEDLIDEFERTEERRNANSMTSDMDTMYLRDDDDLLRDLGLADNASQPGSFGPFDLDVDMNADPFAGHGFGDSQYQELYNDAENALSGWRTERNNSEDSMEMKKKVRFQEPHEVRSRSSSLSSIDDQDPNDAFPDLFDAHDDPSLRANFGLDQDVDAGFQNDYDDTGSCYDFDGDDERLALEIDEESDTDDASSDLDSEDEGDTTDEEDEEEHIARIQAARKAAGRSPMLMPTTPTPSKPSSPTNTQHSAVSTPKSGKGPKMGTFTVDNSRATMSADAQGNRIKVDPPSKPADKEKAFWDRARSAVSSRSSTPRSSVQWSVRTPGPELPPRPFTAQSTLGSMFNGNLDILRNNDVSGIAGDLLPGAAATHPMTSLASGSDYDDSDAEMPEVNMQDFLDIEESGSESDKPASAPITSPVAGADDVFSFPNRSDSLLNHLDQQRGLVGSFRRNQNQVRHVSSLAANPAKRAQTSEYNAMQQGRRAAANTPMTPARKNRASTDLSLTGSGVKKAVGSPLASRRPRSRGNSSAAMQQTLGPSIMQ